MSSKKEVKFNNIPELEGQVVDCKRETALDGRVIVLRGVEGCWY